MLLLYDRPSEKLLALLSGRPDERRPLLSLRDERLHQNLSGIMPFFSITTFTVIMTVIFAVMAHCTYSQSCTYHWANA